MSETTPLAYEPPEWAEAFDKRFSRTKRQARGVVAMINGANDGNTIAGALYSSGLYSTTGSAAQAVTPLIIKINTFFESETGQTVATKNGRLAPYSANPEALETFMRLREHLLPVVLGGDPTEFTDKTLRVDQVREATDKLLALGTLPYVFSYLDTHGEVKLETIRQAIRDDDQREGTNSEYRYVEPHIAKLTILAVIQLV